MGDIYRIHGRLPGCQNGELDAAIGQNFQRLQIGGSFWEPHALGRMLEAILKISDAPHHLGDFIFSPGERENGMVVGLSHGIAHTITLYIAALLGNNHFAGFGVVQIQPGEQGWADVKADALKVAQFGIWGIAMGVNALVPVMVGGCALLFGDLIGQGVFTNGLIKMPVNTKTGRIGRLGRHRDSF